MDKFSTCHKCGSQLCYTFIYGDITSYNCLSCGFNTNSQMVKGNEVFEQIYENLPELYKDVCYTDSEGLVWIPTVINYPEKGMVFLDGTNSSDWGWTAVLATEISEEEKHKFPIPNSDKFYTHKMNMDTKQHFSKEDFVGGLLYIGVIQSQPE